jgi:hypothetical protein
MAVDLTASVHAAITLLATTQDVTTAITAPNTARELSVTGTKAGDSLTGTVTVTGTDDYGQTVTGSFALDGNNTAHAADGQVFATVTSIACPVRVTALDTVKVGYRDRLFSLADARAFDKKQLADAAAYSDAAILAKELEIRRFLERACGVAFVPATYREHVDGTGTDTLYVTKARPLAVTACVIYDSDMVADETFDATDIADLAYYDEGRIVRRSEGYFLKGGKNVLVTYLHGHRAVPELIQRAALQILVTELPSTNIPFAASEYEGEMGNVSFGRGDGFNRNWSRLPDVMKAIRMYDASELGIA